MAIATFTEDQPKADWKQRIPRVPLWVAVGLIISVALLIYYIILGAQYWGIYNRNASLNKQIAASSAALAIPGPDEKALSTDLRSQEQHLAQLNNSFNLAPEGPIAILDATSWEAGIELISISMGDSSTEIRDDVQYRTQPVAVSVNGSLEGISRFLSILDESAPAVGITSIRITGFEAKSTAQVDLKFYLSPQPAPDKKTAPAKAPKAK